MPLRKVKIDSGWVEGAAASIPTITVFRSIPYAAPPVGENRWRAPQPVTPWDGVYKAVEFKPIPPLRKNLPGEMGHEEFYGFGATEQCEEDCLHLSVWTPAQSADEKLPVVMHIHGGAFIEGYSYAATFYGDAFARQGIVFVTVEYRLGILGFMAHPELTAEAPYHASGNYGLLDQLAALKWIRRNIGAFGGNPDRITINGQSAGAISCEYMMYSPLARDDVSKAIIQSGLSFTNHKKMMFAGVQHDLELSQGEELGAKILEGLGAADIREARELPWETILDFQIAHPEINCWPVIDGYYIPQNVDTVIKNGGWKDIPVMLGATLEEGIVLGDTIRPIFTDPEEYKEYVQSAYGDFAEKYLTYNGFCEAPGQLMEGKVMWEEFNAGTLAWCEQAARSGKKEPVYNYLFTRDVPGKGGGAGHSMDLWYSFGNLHLSPHPKEAVDFALEKAMNTYFANFIKTGNPNCEELPPWEPYTLLDRNAMELGDHIGKITNICTPRIQMLVNYIMDD